REFLKSAAGAAACYMVGNASSVFAQVPRREVSIGGRRVTVVDIHGHCAVQEVESVIRGTNVERNVPRNRILGPHRIDLINERGIDVQVLSANQYWWYAADEALAKDIIRVQDDGIAAWIKNYPDRFVALTSVALQHPELAAEQLEYAVRELNFRGASVGGHVAGESLSLAKYDPFWAKAEELDVPVFMHPGGADNVVTETAFDGRGDLGNIIGNPLETTTFLSRMIFEGALDRFPNLKIIASHSGGYLPSYLGRTEVACEVRNNANCANTKLPSEYLRDQILVDSMIFSEEGLRHLVAVVGASQVVYGTDIPLVWPDTLDLILDSPHLSDTDKEAIVGGNLVRLLRI
ncbi:MAG TPA: amidohydrolase family protein, partial [Gammaproteobacteria bacterium]